MLASKLYKCEWDTEYKNLLRKEASMYVLIGANDNLFSIEDDINNGSVGRFGVKNEGLGICKMVQLEDADDISLELPYVCDTLILDKKVNNLYLGMHREYLCLQRNKHCISNIEIDISSVINNGANDVMISTEGDFKRDMHIHVSSDKRCILYLPSNTVKVKVNSNILLLEWRSVNIEICFSDVELRYINLYSKNKIYTNMFVIRSVIIDEAIYINEAVYINEVERSEKDEMVRIPFSVGNDDTGIQIFNRLRDISNKRLEV